MGNAYPMPGLHGKFYDVDQDPLVEVVRDTVGRHDTFGLACTSKYYEDAGYFGHINCTDNFNGVLEPYPIAPRRGWNALNFFYNTSFDADMILLADEPWSRPGDYVLLRASDDLVCASSACPDDIDPANAWECTDVHVRVYPAQNRFSMAVAHRVTADAEPELSKETAFHPRTSQLTRTFVEYRGYWLPHCYDNEGAVSEYLACRERAAVIDLSPLRKWEVLGPDAELLLQRTCTRDIRRLAAGQVVYTALCNETGGMIDDATVFRLGDDNFRFVGGDPYDGVWLKEQAEGLRAWVKPSTDQLHNLAVQGPRSREILAGLIWTPATQTAFEELKWFRFCVGRIGDYDGIPVVVSRTGYSGELGYEVWCHPSDGPAVWDAIWEAGQASRDAAARARRARRPAHRGGPDLRGLRVRRPGRPVRGRHRLHRRPGHHRRGLRRPRRARGAQGRTRSARSSGSSSRATRSPATATTSTSAASGSAWSRAAAAARTASARSRSAGWRSSTPSWAPRSRSASSTGCRSASPLRWSASRSTTPTRPGLAREPLRIAARRRDAHPDQPRGGARPPAQGDGPLRHRRHGRHHRRSATRCTA